MPAHKLQSLPDVKRIPLSKGKTTTYSDPDAKRAGIRLAVSANEKKWIFTRRVNGRVKTDVVGAFPDMPTIHAAAEAASTMFTVAAVKSSAKGSGLRTMQDAFEQVLENSSAREGTLRTYRRQVAKHLSDLFAMPVDEITLTDLEDALRPHLTKHDGVLRATRTYTALKHIITMTFKRVEAVRRIPNVANGLREIKALPKRNKVQFDVDDTWPVLDMIDAKKETRFDLLAYGWELMLFTGLRSINAKQIAWSDIDLEKATLHIARLKNEREIKFPLSQRVMSILRYLHDRTGHQRWVFPCHVEKKAGQHVYGFGHELVDGDRRVTPHDMRRLFTTAARRARLPGYVVDQLRGDVGQKIADLYDQGSITHGDLDAVAKQIDILCGRNPDAQVVPLRARS